MAGHWDGATRTSGTPWVAAQGHWDIGDSEVGTESGRTGGQRDGSSRTPGQGTGTWWQKVTQGGGNGTLQVTQGWQEVTQGWHRDDPEVTQGFPGWQVTQG